VTAETVAPRTELTPVEKAWTIGQAEGSSHAAWLGTPMQEFALEQIAEWRQWAVYGRTLDAVLGDYFRTDLESRVRRARASGMLFAFSEDTCERSDAERCSNCWLIVLTEIMEHFVCPCGEHGTTCSEACRDEKCRLVRCGDDR
jgi:hypothetical protein